MSHTDPADKAAIRDLEEKRYHSLLAQDYDTFEDLCHTLLVYGHGDGNSDSRQSYVDKLRTGALRFASVEHSVETVTVVGDTALLRGVMNAEIVINDHISKTLHNNALIVWTREAGSWKLLAHQPTPLNPG